MPTNRNTLKTSSRRTIGSYSLFGGSYNPRRSSSSSRSGSSTRSIWGSGSFSSSGSRSNTNTTSYSPNKFSSQRNEISAKIGSLRTISQQVSAGKVTAFSPATCEKWINLVNDGCSVYKFSTIEFSRYFGSQLNHCTPNTAQRILNNRFGTGIKAVTRGKGNSWLVVATDRVTARPFSTYNWK